MNLQNMEYFLTVCKYGTITQASEALFVSQQALSQTIKKIEDEFGEQLFYRSNPMELTESGKKVQKSFTKILEEYNALTAEFQSSKQESTLVVGYVGGLKGTVNSMIDEYQKTHPDVTVKLMKLKENTAPENVSLIFSKKKMEAYNLVKEFSNQVSLWMKGNPEKTSMLEQFMNMLKEKQPGGNKDE